MNDDTAFLQLIQQLLEDEGHETRSILVIVASANLQALAGREEQLAEKGIYVIAKPFDIDELGAIMRTALSRRRPQPKRTIRPTSERSNL